MELDQVLSHFHNPRRNGAGFMAKCPAHDDGTNSLSVGEGDSGKILLKCQAGCPTDDIIEAVGLSWRDLSGGNGHETRNQSSDRSSNGNDVCARYTYTDETGKPLFQVSRTRSKHFFQSRFDSASGKFIPGMNGTRRTLFHLPDVIAAETVFVVEGEKDADRLISLGLTASTNPGGAGKWSNDYTQTLKGKNVVIIPDNDEPGRQHALAIAKAVFPVVVSVKIVTLPDLPPKGDVSDYLAAHSKEDLLALVDAAKLYTGETEKPQSKPARKWVDEMETIEEQTVDWLWGNRIPRGRLTEFLGDPGVGKSHACQAIAASLSVGAALPGDVEPEAPLRTLILNFEDGAGDTIKPHLRLLGADMKMVGVPAKSNHLLPSQFTANVLEQMLNEFPAALVVIDPALAIMSRKNTDRASDVRDVLSPLAELAEKRNVAIILIRHLNKSVQSRAIYRGQGSIDFNAIVRSSFIFGQDDNDPDRRFMCHQKNSLGKKMPTLECSIGDDGVFRWGNETSQSVDEVLGSNQPKQRERNQFEAAKAFLEEVLPKGPIPTNELKDKAAKQGLAWRTVWRAAEDMDIKRSKERDTGAWWWRLA